MYITYVLQILVIHVQYSVVEDMCTRAI